MEDEESEEEDEEEDDAEEDEKEEGEIEDEKEEGEIDEEKDEKDEDNEDDDDDEEEDDEGKEESAEKEEKDDDESSEASSKKKKDQSAVEGTNHPRNFLRTFYRPIVAIMNQYTYTYQVFLGLILDRWSMVLISRRSWEVGTATRGVRWAILQKSAPSARCVDHS